MERKSFPSGLNSTRFSGIRYGPPSQEKKLSSQPSSSTFTQQSPMTAALGARRQASSYRASVQPRRGNRRRRGRASSNNELTMSDVKRMASAAWSGVKSIARLINVEEKLFDVNTSGNISSSGTIFNLSNIAEGSDFNNRDGLSVLTQSLSFSSIFTQSISATNTFLRFIIFRDNSQRGVDPAVTDVLESAIVHSPIVHFSASRFNILMDKTVDLASVSKPLGHHRENFNINKHIYYSATSGADASNYQGALFLLALSNEATNTPTLAFYTRLAFTDN